MAEFYIKIARKKFVPNFFFFGGGARAPPVPFPTPMSLHVDITDFYFICQGPRTAPLIHLRQLWRYTNLI